jgi:hypothetical protein
LLRLKAAIKALSNTIQKGVEVLPKTTRGTSAAMRAAKAAKVAQRRANPVRREWLDQDYHERLAKVFGIRLPPPGEVPTPSVMRRFLNRVRRSVRWWYGETGFSRLDQFSECNPECSAREWGCTVLESVAREDRTVIPAQQSLELAAS